MKKDEEIKQNFKNALRHVVANAIVKKANGKPVFSEQKIIGQIDMTVDHFLENAKKQMIDEIKKTMYQMPAIRKIQIETETLEVLTKYQVANLLNCYPYTPHDEEPNYD